MRKSNKPYNELHEITSSSGNSQLRSRKLKVPKMQKLSTQTPQNRVSGSVSPTIPIAPQI